MKRLLQLIVAIIFISCGSKSHVAQDIDDRYPINGRVSSIKIISYDAVSRFGEAHKADEDDYEDYILINLDKDGYLDSFYSYWYSSYDRCDMLSSYVKYQYSDGRITSMTFYDYSGEEDGEVVWSYLNDQLSRIDTFDADGELKSYQQFEYLDDGVIISSSLDPTGALLGRSINTLSEAAYRKALTSFAADNDDITSVSLSNGRQLLAVSDGKVERRAFYNANGDVERCEGFRLSPDGSSFLHADIATFYLYTYQYDSKKNWVKRVCYEGAAKQPIEITERFIEYDD